MSSSAPASLTIMPAQVNVHLNLNLNENVNLNLNLHLNTARALAAVATPQLNHMTRQCSLAQFMHRSRT